MNKDMAAAPRDGTVVVVLLPDGHTAEAAWNPTIGFWMMPGGTVLNPAPVAWRDLEE